MDKRKKRTGESSEKIHVGTQAIDRKTTRFADGSVRHQYPARVGFHGSDKEEKLNPEE